MSKTNKTLLLIFVLILSLNATVHGQSNFKEISTVLNSVNLEVNGKKVIADNINFKDTAYVPLRSISEMLNKEVLWNQETKTASINNNTGKTIDLTENKSSEKSKQKIKVIFNSINIEVNGKKINSDNILYKGTTYVPLRAISEMLDKEVLWNQETRTASINNKVNPDAINFPDPNLEKAIRKEINKPDGDILKSDVIGVRSLNLDNLEIATLKGLEHFEQLEELSIYNNFIKDLSPLQDILTVKRVNFQHNNINDLSPLQSNKMNAVSISGYGNPANNTIDIEPKLQAIGILYVNEDYDKAYNYAAKILDIDPYNTRLNLLIGRILADNGNFKESVPYLEQATSEKDTPWVKAWSLAYLGQAYINLGDSDAAEGFLNDAIKLNATESATKFAKMLLNEIK